MLASPLKQVCQRSVSGQLVPWSERTAVTQNTTVAEGRKKHLCMKQDVLTSPNFLAQLMRSRHNIGTLLVKLFITSYEGFGVLEDVL